MSDQHTIVKVCMLAGKIMLQSGAETYRVEDTMNRIASTCGLSNAQSYATPTGINFSIDMSEATNFMRISNRSTDLHKITEVNTISRMIAAGEVEINEALTMLKRVEKETPTFSGWLQVIAAAFVSGCFTIMFGGIWADFIPSFVVGGVAFCGMLSFDRLFEIRFISEFFASIIIGVLAIVFVEIGIGVEVDKIIIGAVMPLVPGLHITNAVRDLMAGHLVAGVSKGVEAVLTAFAIGAGVAVVFGFL